MKQEQNLVNGKPFLQTREIFTDRYGNLRVFACYGYSFQTSPHATIIQLSNHKRMPAQQHVTNMCMSS